MGLIELLTRVACSQAHVLIAEAPGAFRQRVALECALDQMGWRRAESVADADVLAVVGQPGTQLTSLIEGAWAQMSEPRTRIEVTADSDLAAALKAARKVLTDRPLQASDAVERAGFTPAAEGASAHEHSKPEHEHGEMSPDGIPLAHGAADRDGLEMDELHLPLGPVLADWPAGLVLRVTLHGDIVTDAEVEQLPAADPSPPADDGSTRAARLLDAAVSVLTLAGLPAEAALARRLRNQCLDGEPTDTGAVQRLGQRVRRNRVLRWLLSGLTSTGMHGGTENLHNQLVALFERAQAELNGDATSDGAPGIQALPDLVRGQELSAVRLWIAAIAPDLANQALKEPAHE